MPALTTVPEPSLTRASSAAWAGEDCRVPAQQKLLSSCRHADAVHHTGHPVKLSTSPGSVAPEGTVTALGWGLLPPSLPCFMPRTDLKGQRHESKDSRVHTGTYLRVHSEMKREPNSGLHRLTLHGPVEPSGGVWGLTQPRWSSLGLGRSRGHPSWRPETARTAAAGPPHRRDAGDCDFGLASDVSMGKGQIIGERCLEPQ